MIRAGSCTIALGSKHTHNQWFTKVQIPRARKDMKGWGCCEIMEKALRIVHLHNLWVQICTNADIKPVFGHQKSSASSATITHQQAAKAPARPNLDFGRVRTTETLVGSPLQSCHIFTHPSLVISSLQHPYSVFTALDPSVGQAAEDVFNEQSERHTKHAWTGGQ